jgi:glycosyltransferase involved in cell wall biosynthesis
MKICIITPSDIFPPTSGAANRIFRIAEGLCSCGAQVSVFHHGSTVCISSNFELLNFKSFGPLPEGSDYFHPLNPFFPSQLGRFLSKVRPDIVQCEGPWSIFPTLFLTRSFRISCVLDEHNVEVLWSLYASRVPFLASYTFAIEKFALSNSDLVLTTSEVDKSLISKIYRTDKGKIFVVPNGVSLERFSAISCPQSELKKKLGLSPVKKLVLFHGIMSARQNYEAARLILDSIAPQIIDATFIIIGRNSPQWLRMKAKEQRNVLILGFVPNIEEYIMATDICIAPIQRGSGTRLKVLEYLAAGKPIVATFKAVEGIPLVNQVHSLLFGEVGEDFVDAIKKLLIDDSLAEKLGSNARHLGIKFNWDNVANKLYDKYESLLSGKR